MSQIKRCLDIRASHFILGVGHTLIDQLEILSWYFMVVVQHVEITVMAHDMLEVILQEHLRWTLQSWILVLNGLHLDKIILHLSLITKNNI